MSEQSQYIYKTTIKQTYGLTESWIKRLGEPDKIVPNPYYRAGPPSSLYSRARVEAFIDAHQEEYADLLAKRAARSARAQEVMDRRIEDLLEWAGAASIEIHRLPALQSLKEAVLEQHKNFALYRGRDLDFTMSKNAMVAFVRHNLTNYEALLSRIEGKPGTGLAYLVIRDMCDSAIEERLRECYSDDAKIDAMF